MKELNLLPQNQRNRAIQLDQFIAEKGIEGFNTSLGKVYYPYNYDVQDLGWECAWRAIQTLLSPQQTTFYDLFTHYAKYDTLRTIILETQKSPIALQQLQLTKAQWCPEYNSNGWAEPFIGRLVLNSLKIDNQLIGVNSVPVNANAPKTAFDIVLNFYNFKQKLISHFQNKRGTVFIDDASYAMSIWGCKQEGQYFKILVADPHIKSNKEEKNTGIYQVTLNQLGNQVTNTITEPEKSNFSFQSYQSIRFENKSWMALFPSK